MKLVEYNEEPLVESRLLMLPSEVIALAWAEGEYVDVRLLSSAVMWDVQRRYIVPIIGDALLDALLLGSYREVCDSFVKPAMAMMVRVNLELPAHIATKRERSRARGLLRGLTDYLNLHAEQIAEYDPCHNVQNRVELAGGFVG